MVFLNHLPYSACPTSSYMLILFNWFLLIYQMLLNFKSYFHTRHRERIACSSDGFTKPESTNHDLFSQKWMLVSWNYLMYVWMRHELVYCPLLTSYTFHCLSIRLNENTTWILVTFKGFSVFCIATRSYHPPRWYLSSTSQPWFIIFWHR